MNRRTLLSALVVPLAALLVAAPTPVRVGPGEGIAIPGGRAIDHTGFTVPDLEPAIAFLTDIFGVAVLWRSAPFSAGGHGSKVPSGLNADPRAFARLAMLRLRPNLNVELIGYRIPGMAQVMPLGTGLNVGHLAFEVADIHVAGAHLRAKRVQLLEGPHHNTEGPNAGQDSWFFLTPWRMAVELVPRPAVVPYERDTDARLFKAAARPDVAMVPVPVPAQTSPAMEQEILRLENERVRAMIERDYPALERLMAPECVHIESNGTVRTTSEFMDNFRTDGFVFDAFVIEENRVRFYGATAVVTGRYHNVVRTKGQPQPLKRARHTRVWARQTDGRWRMVSHQATEIPAAKEQKP